MRSIRTLRATGVDYHVALDWQHTTAAALRTGTGAEAIALIEHTPVYTMGARGGRATVLAPLDALPAPLVDTDRGGDITWHGPGQLVAYPILNLRARAIRAVDYVRRLEAVLIDTLAAFDIEGAAMPGRPGVWVGGAKIAAIGVRIQGGVSTHGIALNVAPDLAWYDPIVPCGIAGAGVTSIARELASDPLARSRGRAGVGVCRATVSARPEPVEGRGTRSVPSMTAAIEAFRNAFAHHFNAVLSPANPVPLAPSRGEGPRDRREHENAVGVRAR